MKHMIVENNSKVAVPTKKEKSKIGLLRHYDKGPNLSILYNNSYKLFVCFCVCV